MVCVERPGIRRSTCRRSGGLVRRWCVCFASMSECGDELGGGAPRPAIRFLAGRDTRESGEWIERELAFGIRSQGGTLTSAGIIPTPAVAYLTPRMGYTAGVVISASHNPFEDNGIKVFSGAGEKFTEALERTSKPSSPMPSWTVPDGDAGRGRAGRSPLGVHRAPARDSPAGRAHRRHAARRSIAPTARRRRSRRGCSRNSASTCATSAVQPDGRNINLQCGSTAPERAGAGWSSRAATRSASRSTATATARSSSTRPARSSMATP